MKRVSRLYTGSLRYLLFLEIVFKVLGVFVLLPLAGGILQTALRFSSVHYIAAQNYRMVFRQPLLIAALILIALLIIGFLNFEVTCITISYQQTYFKKKISYYQLLKESARRSLKLIRPSNWLLIPVTILMLPTLFYFVQNSSNVYIKIVQQVAEDLMRMFPVNLLLVSLFILVLVMAVMGMYTYQFHITQSLSGWRSVIASLRLLKNHWKQVLSGILIWMAILGSVLLILHIGVYLLIRLGVYVFVQEEARRAMLVTIYYYVRNFMNFISYSLMAFGWYGYVASSYYRYVERFPHMDPKPLERKRDPRAGKRGGIAVAILGGFIAVTLAVNALVVRSADAEWGSGLWDDKVAIMAHRGASEEKPENTIEAFWAAAEQGADYIELDCQLSKDGVVMVHHDTSLKRCWGVEEDVQNLTYEELRQIRDTEGHHIPTLREVFFELKDSWLEFNIELKVTPFEDETALVREVMEIIQEYEIQERCVIQSFNYEVLEAVKAIDDTMQCGYILTTAAGHYYDLDAADFFSMNISFLTERTVSSIHLRDKKILVWTVNSEKMMEEAVDLKVDGIITDRPLLAREVVYGSQLPLEEFVQEELLLENTTEETETP